MTDDTSRPDEPAGDPRMRLTIKDMPKHEPQGGADAAHERMGVAGEMRDHYRDGKYVSRHQRGGNQGE